MNTEEELKAFKDTVNKQELKRADQQLPYLES